MFLSYIIKIKVYLVLGILSKALPVIFAGLFRLLTLATNFLGSTCATYVKSKIILVIFNLIIAKI